MTDEELDRLEEEYRALVQRADPVPPWVTDGARMAFGLRTLAAELLVLELDSAEASAEALVRTGEFGARELSFARGERSVEVEVVETGPRMRRVVGLLVPPRSTTIEVEQVREGAPVVARVIETDELGRFAIEALPAGPTRLRLVQAADEPTEVTTEWTVL